MSSYPVLLTKTETLKPTKTSLDNKETGTVKPLGNGNFQILFDKTPVGIFYSEQQAKDTLSTFVRMGLCKT